MPTATHCALNKTSMEVREQENGESESNKEGKEQWWVKGKNVTQSDTKRGEGKHVW